MCSKYGTFHFDGKSEATKSSRFAIAYATELASAGDLASWIMIIENTCLIVWKVGRFSEIGKEEIIRLGTKLNKSKTADICRVPYDKTERKWCLIDWWLEIDGSVRNVKTC